MYECYKCGREFNKPEGLSKHVKSCTGKRYCLNCGIEIKTLKYCSNTCAKLYTPIKKPDIKTKSKSINIIHTIEKPKKVVILNSKKKKQRNKKLLTIMPSSLNG